MLSCGHPQQFRNGGCSGRVARNLRRSLLMSRLTFPLYAFLLVSACSDSVPESYESPAVVEALGSAQDCCLYTGDLWPAAKSVLNSKAFFKWSDDMRKFSGRFHRGQLLTQLRSSKETWPTGAAIGVSTPTVGALAALVRTTIGLSLAEKAYELEDQAFAHEVVVSLVQYLPAIENGHFALTVEFRDTQTVSEIWASLTSQTAILASVPGAELSQTEHAIEASLALASLLNVVLPDVLPELLETLSYGDNESAAVVAERIEGWKLPLRLWTAGNTIGFSVGRSAEATHPFRSEEIRAFATHPIAARWDAGTFHKDLFELNVDLSRWLGHPVGQAVLAEDEDHFIQDMRRLQQQSRMDSQSGLVRIEFGTTTRMEIEQFDIEPVSSLADSTARRAIPDSIRWYMADATTSLSDTILDYVSDTEDRAARKELQAELSTSETAQESARRAVETFETYLRPMADALRSGIDGVFGTPWSVMYDGTQGAVSEAGEAATVPKFAAIAPVLDPKRADELGPMLYGALQEIFDWPRRELEVTQVQLELGQPTQGFKQMGAGEDSIYLEPRHAHWFRIGEVWVFSTSVELSQTILDRLASEPSETGDSSVVYEASNLFTAIAHLAQEYPWLLGSGGTEQLQQVVTRTLERVSDYHDVSLQADRTRTRTIQIEFD